MIQVSIAKPYGSSMNFKVKADNSLSTFLIIKNLLEEIRVKTILYWLDKNHIVLELTTSTSSLPEIKNRILELFNSNNRS